MRDWNSSRPSKIVSSLKAALLAAGRRRTLAGVVRRSATASKSDAQAYGTDAPNSYALPAVQQRGVFISYTHRDRKLAARLARYLAGRGIEVWWDRRLTPGEEFRKDIAASLRRARAVVVIWSETSAASHFVLDEAGHALRTGKLIPTLAPGCGSATLPLGFGQLHTIGLNDRAALLGALLALGVRRHRSVATRTAAAPMSAP